MRFQVKLPRMRAEVPCPCGIKVDFCVKKMPTGSECVPDTLAGAAHCAGTAQVTGMMFQVNTCKDTIFPSHPCV